jgi:hypothetical protein
LLYTRKIHNAEKDNSSRMARPKQVRHFLDATQATTLNLILPPTHPPPAALSQDGNKLKSARARDTDIFFALFFHVAIGVRAAVQFAVS